MHVTHISSPAFHHSGQPRDLLFAVTSLCALLLILSTWCWEGLVNERTFEPQTLDNLMPGTTTPELAPALSRAVEITALAPVLAPAVVTLPLAHVAPAPQAVASPDMGHHRLSRSAPPTPAATEQSHRWGRVRALLLNLISMRADSSHNH
jgi:hypothetical protein